jgi:hypothetical protein
MVSGGCHDNASSPKISVLAATDDVILVFWP